MSRSGYTDDCDDNWQMIRWRGAVASAVRGKRGQAFFRELVVALDAMPEKALVRDELMTPEGDFCAMGCVLRARGMMSQDIQNLDPEDPVMVGKAIGLAPALVQEIAYQNDDTDYRRDDPRERWRRVRAWAEAQIKK